MLQPGTPDLGFLDGPTIFGALTSHGVEWRLFESDLSLVRTYNQHCLDTQRITPLINKRDPSQNFWEIAKRGQLPPVVFVEPNFSDIPPLKSANDDLVPVDLRKGQNFVSYVHNALKQSPAKWRKTMLVITYDEHGGFSDHVAPPGTPLPLGPPEWVGKIPKVNQDGADSLGVRVPAFVISPMVSAGQSVKKFLIIRRFSKQYCCAIGPNSPQTNSLNSAHARMARIIWALLSIWKARRPIIMRLFHRWQERRWSAPAQPRRHREKPN